MKKIPFYALRIILTLVFIILIGLVLHKDDMLFNPLSKIFWIPIFYGDSLGALIASLIKRDHKPSLIPKGVIQGVVVTLYLLLFWKTDPAASIFMLIIHLFIISVFIAGLDYLVKKVLTTGKEGNKKESLY